MKKFATVPFLNLSSVSGEVSARARHTGEDNWSRASSHCLAVDIEADALRKPYADRSQDAHLRKRLFPLLDP